MAIKAKCQKCGDDFLIITKEVEFYKEKDFPLPTDCPNCRLKRRMSLRDRKELLGYSCDNCQKDIITAVEPKEGRKIFCKGCYQKYMEENDCILGESEGFKVNKKEAGSNQENTDGKEETQDPIDW